jgi:hypothetical protein
MACSGTALLYFIGRILPTLPRLYEPQMLWSIIAINTIINCEYESVQRLIRARVTGSLLGQSMWDLWWAKWQWDRFLSEFFGFSAVNIIPPSSSILIYHPGDEHYVC